MRLLAEVVITGRCLHLKDLVVYPDEAVAITGVTRELMVAKAALLRDARRAGFHKLRITAERVAGSTSANPGKRIDWTIDLSEE